MVGLAGRRFDLYQFTLLVRNLPLRTRMPHCDLDDLGCRPRGRGNTFLDTARTLMPDTICPHMRRGVFQLPQPHLHGLWL